MNGKLYRPFKLMGSYNTILKYELIKTSKYTYFDQILALLQIAFI